VSDYLTALATRTLAPPASIRPRPAAHFESFTAADRSRGSDTIPPTLPTGVASRVHVNPSSSGRGLGDDAPERPEASAGVRSSQDPRRGTDERHVPGAPPGRPSEKKSERERDVSPPRKSPVLESVAAQVPRGERSGNPSVPATDLAISEIEAGPDEEPRRAPTERRTDESRAPRPERWVDDGAGSKTVSPMDDRDSRSDDHVTPLVARAASRAAIKSAPRAPIVRAQADRDESPHITVTIGRIEVTSPVHEPPSTNKGIRDPALGLDDYLEGRDRS
jgi:hypothetical protein